jgi:hypothetical protein
MTENEEAATDGAASEVPPDVVEEVERLTRLARDAVDDAEASAYREHRDELVADYDFVARVREEDDDTLVLYPDEWVEDGTVYPERIDELDRGIERPLEGAGSADDWATVEAENRAVAETVADEYGEVHGQNAHALADFASNHYAKPIAALTREETREFLHEYFPRNAFPSDDQKAVVEESVEYAVDAAGGTLDVIGDSR